MYSNVQKLQERIKFVPVSQLINKYHQYIILDFGIKGYDPIGGGATTLSNHSYKLPSNPLRANRL